MRPALPALLLAATVFAAIFTQQSTTMARRQAQPAAGWRTFAGTWTVSGQQTLLPTERPQPASITQLSGAVALEAVEGLTRAFRGQVITYDDGSGAVVGRVAWTDHNDDRIFSTLKGDLMTLRRNVSGTFTGGTGAYAGIAGDYTFEWQYVFTGEGAAIQGRAVNLRGRFRTGR